MKKSIDVSPMVHSFTASIGQCFKLLTNDKIKNKKNLELSKVFPIDGRVWL